MQIYFDGYIDDIDELGRLIAKTRKSMKLKRAELASRAGIARVHIFRIEEGRARSRDISISTLCKLAGALGIQVRIGTIFNGHRAGDPHDAVGQKDKTGMLA